MRGSASVVGPLLLVMASAGLSTAADDFATPRPGSYALPPIGAAADGQVLTGDGVPDRLHALFGPDVVLLSFIYTRCTDGEGCPFATAVLHSIGTRLAASPALRPRVRLLSLSFDPRRDTPDVMRRYGERFARNGLDWRFLTTDGEASLAPILAAYRQTRVPEVDAGGQETGQFAHLLRVFLIDREGRIRQVYSTALLELDALMADIETILLERSAPAAARAVKGQSPESTASHRPGDDRSGYEAIGYTTQTLPLKARRGREADLFMRLERPILGLPRMPVPVDNPLSAEKIALGRRLFFDRRLSLNDTISCGMCHVPEQGFTHNEMATSVGIEGRTVRRNAPTIYNAAFLSTLFHDGRAASLEEQVWGPLLASNEMGNGSAESLIEKLRRTSDYADRFERAFPAKGLTRSTLGQALASYERTLVSGDSAFDRFHYGKQDDALTPSAQRGLALFAGRARCAICHTIGSDAALFSDQSFHNTGVGASTGAIPDPERTVRVQAAPGVFLQVPAAVIAAVSEPSTRDLGRFEVTRDPADRGRYRTPSLRNVALTAPYMHDGSLATLREVVEFYRRGGIPNDGLDPLIGALDLSNGEVDDLVAFLRSLTGGDVETLVADSFAAPVGDVDRWDRTDRGGGAMRLVCAGSPGRCRRVEWSASFRGAGAPLPDRPQTQDSGETSGER